MPIHAAVEQFHLRFCAQLARRVDPALWVLKGGTNLRWFHHSPRYSEDVDLDVQTVAPRTLRKHVETVLTSRPLEAALQLSRLTIATTSAAKQTDTTQRWKVLLMQQGHVAPIPTKIEFSRRTETWLEHAYTRVDPLLCSSYAIPPFALTHYTAEAAATQKLEALVGRTEVQARDVFDLDLLASKETTPIEATVSAEMLAAAEARVLELPFEAYAAQVVAWLPEEERLGRQRPEAWTDLQLRVLSWLERLRG